METALFSQRDRLYDILMSYQGKCSNLKLETPSATNNQGKKLSLAAELQEGKIKDIASTVTLYTARDSPLPTAFIRETIEAYGGGSIVLYGLSKALISISYKSKFSLYVSTGLFTQENCLNINEPLTAEETEALKKALATLRIPYAAETNTVKGWQIRNKVTAEALAEAFVSLLPYNPAMFSVGKGSSITTFLKEEGYFDKQPQRLFHANFGKHSKNGISEKETNNLQEMIEDHLDVRFNEFVWRHVL